MVISNLKQYIYT